MQQGLRPTSGLAGLSAAGLIGLGVFSLLYSIGSAFELWPPPPVGGLAPWDLAVGLGFGVCLLLALLFRSRGKTPRAPFPSR